jgi:dihydroflavonol-4-reductase
MNAFVTGGTGFVGANLVEALSARGLRVRVLHRPQSSLAALAGLSYETAVGDILDPPEKLAEAMAGCDWVFHAAAVADYWRQNQERIHQINVTGTEKMLAAARLAGVKRFVFTSSIAALGVPANGQLLTEADRFNLRPDQFYYGYSKHLAERAVREAAAAGLPAVIVNPSVILGPRDVNAISGSLLLELARGRMRFIPPGGVNFVAVRDVVAGHIAAAEKGQPGERYILGGHNLSFAEAVPIICQVVGQSPPRWLLPARLLPIVALTVSAARTLLGPRLPLDADQVRLASAFIFVDDSKARQTFQLKPTPFATAVQEAWYWYKVQA